MSGPDRVGCGAELWAALEAVTRTGGVLADVGQITIRGSLVLCADIVVPEDVTLEDVRRALAERDLERDGLRAEVVAVHPEVHDAGGRLLVTLLAPRVGAEQLHRIFTGIASVGATCERIVHLAKYPVDAYELAVRGCDSDALRAAVTGAAQEVGVDLAVQRAGLHRRAKHLVVMDADSTLLQDEVIDLLAEACNCAEEVASITERAMAGELDFAASLRARVALLEGLPESVLDDVRQRLRLTPGARTLVRTLLRLGYVPAVVSGGFEEVLAPLLQELGVGLWRANRLEVRDGRLTGRVVGDIVDRAGKARALESFAQDVGVPLAQTVAVGDGANDIDMISVAGLGIAFNAKPVVRAHADTALSVPYLDAVLYFLGISREEIEDEALAPAEGA